MLQVALLRAENARLQEKLKVMEDELQRSHLHRESSDQL